VRACGPLDKKGSEGHPRAPGKGLRLLHSQLGNLFAGGLALLFGTPISLLIGGILSLIAAIVGRILRKPAEKSLAASTSAMRIE